MKKLLLTAIIAVSAFTAKSQWINQNVPLTYDGYMNDIEVTDANTAWGNPWNGTAGAATPYTSDFTRTIDGGTTWTVGNIGATAGLVISNIWPIDATTCYVCMCNVTTGGGAVYKTTNGGTSWVQVGTNMFQNATSFGNVVYFWDANNGMAMGDPIGAGANKRYEIYTTTDAGATWNLVPIANIPALTNASEYGITNLFSAADGVMWFGTIYGDLLKSSDMGVTWTKSPTGLPSTGGTQDINDIAFTDANNGIVVQYDATAGTYTLRNTTDGGATWNTVTPTGNFYPTEIEAVPGSSILVSAGSSNAFGFGTSFSSDNGVTWTDLDAGASHTAVDFVNGTTGYGGEFIALGGPGGAWKFNGSFAVVPCGDPSISAGTSAVNEVNVCFGDTLRFTTAGAVAPTDGTIHGYSVLVSSADISGNSDPLSDPSILGGTGTISSSATVTLINDGLIFPAGTYYLTGLVYGNATDPSGTGNVTGYALDPSCTVTGTSVLVNILADGDPLCSGVPEECASAADINNLLGGAVGTVLSSGPWNNTASTSGPTDPTIGFECFGEPDGGGAAPELNNTLWYTFTGDGNLYFIEATNICSGVTNGLADNDSQIALYTGTCGNLTPVDCNEDGPNATATTYPAGLSFQTTLGTVYYMLVDGFSFNGTVSTGEFCVQFTNQSVVNCGAPNINPGVGVMNFPTICFDSTMTFTVSNIVAPTVGTTHGYSVLVSSADISGNSDPLSDPSILGGTGVVAAGAAPVVTNLLNDGAIFPAGVYYFTPLVYGNATGTGNITALTLDPTCTYTGNSVMVTLLGPGDPCPTGVEENEANNTFSIRNLYPVPVKETLNFTINTKDNSAVTVSVKDNIGREVMAQKMNTTIGENKISLDMTKQSAGVYFITATSNKSTVVSKFVKQ